jgi:4-diphosphocytidyl-2-C-methyl-D-erythritol kinase
MERRERRNAVTVLAPAKLNLALDVVGLLPNGYHALDMTMQTITLYERVMLRRSAGLSLRLPGSLVQPNDKNTAIKAALAFFHYTGLLAGVDITIYKNTPVRAGMAGGSADAAAVLVGLNALYGAKLSMSELCALGAGIGADVPFALMGGTCRVQGVGDLLKALPPVPDCWFTVVMPDYGVSTPEAFAAYDTVGSSIHPDCEAQEKAIRAGDLDAVCAAAGNALEECSGAKDNEAIKALLRAHGAVTALMTGSGAAVFGVFRDEAAARTAAAAAGLRCQARPRRCTGDPIKKYKPPSRRAYWPQRKEVFFVQTFYKICLLLLIVGGVNWGLVGLFQFDLVGWLLGGSTSVWSRIVFALVGLAALGCIPELFSEEPEEE